MFSISASVFESKTLKPLGVSCPCRFTMRTGHSTTELSFCPLWIAHLKPNSWVVTSQQSIRERRPSWPSAFRPCSLWDWRDDKIVWGEILFDAWVLWVFIWVATIGCSGRYDFFLCLWVQRTLREFFAWTSWFGDLGETWELQKVDDLMAQVAPRTILMVGTVVGRKMASLFFEPNPGGHYIVSFIIN